MKKILVPTDFSKCAGSAMTYALNIALQTNAEIVCLHSISPYEGVDVDGSGLLWIKEYQQAKAKSLETWVKRFKRNVKFKDVKLSTRCNIGFTVSDIAEQAKDESVDLIIMGTTGATGVGGMLFGSVAGGVISTTKTPTFLIPINGKYSETSSFAMASDFQNHCSKESLDCTIDLLKAHHQNSMKVVHVLAPKAVQPSAQQEKAISDKFKGIKLSFTYLHDDHIPNAINNFLEVSNTKVLCAIPHQHGYMHKLFKGSVTKKLAYQAHTPLLFLFD